MPESESVEQTGAGGAPRFDLSTAPDIEVVAEDVGHPAPPAGSLERSAQSVPDPEVLPANRDHRSGQVRPS